jgi:hypothetical protein
MKGAFKLQKKPPALPQSYKTWNFFTFLCRSSFPPGSGSRNPLESGSGSETLIGSLNTVQEEKIVHKKRTLKKFHDLEEDVPYSDMDPDSEHLVISGF